MLEAGIQLVASDPKDMSELNDVINILNGGTPSFSIEIPQVENSKYSHFFDNSTLHRLRVQK